MENRSENANTHIWKFKFFISQKRLSQIEIKFLKSFTLPTLLPKKTFFSARQNLKTIIDIPLDFGSSKKLFVCSIKPFNFGPKKRAMKTFLSKVVNFQTPLKPSKLNSTYHPSSSVTRSESCIPYN